MMVLLVSFCGCVAYHWYVCVVLFFFFFQAEDGIRDLVRSRGLGDVYKRQVDDPERATRRATLGISDDNASCHTAVFGNAAIEGLSLIHI